MEAFGSFETGTTACCPRYSAESAIASGTATNVTTSAAGTPKSWRSIG